MRKEPSILIIEQVYADIVNAVETASRYGELLDNPDMLYEQLNQLVNIINQSKHEVIAHVE